MSDDEREYADLVNRTELPAWVAAELPAPKQHVVLSYSDGLYHVSGWDKTFDSIVEAHDAVQADSSLDLVFDKSVNGVHGELNQPFFTCDPEEGEENSRLLMGWTQDDAIDDLKHSYGTWLEVVDAQYQANPGDWALAYTWLTRHPIFWRLGANRAHVSWDTEFGFEDHHVWLNKDDEGETQVWMETGPHTKQYDRRYLDMRLTVHAPTFEEAYVLLAAKVNKFYTSDGYEKDVTE
jgi:hypothetical protein